MSRWQRGDLAGARERCGRAPDLAARLGDPRLGRDAHEVPADVATAEGDLPTAAGRPERSADLSRAAGDDTTLLMALVDRTVVATYAGDDAAARWEAAALAQAERMGSPHARGWAAYTAGERRAEAGDPDAGVHLERAVALAGEVDAAFLAGVARHTLSTTAARVADPEPARFGPLLDAWLATGAWTQLWVAVRALAGVLSRQGRHREATLLLGALHAGPRASREYGADAARVRAVADAARAVPGAGYAAVHAGGAALGDAGAAAPARRLSR